MHTFAHVKPELTFQGPENSFSATCSLAEKVVAIRVQRRAVRLGQGRSFQFSLFYSYLDVFQKLSVDGDQFRRDPHHDDLETDDQQNSG